MAMTYGSLAKYRKQPTTARYILRRMGASQSEIDAVVDSLALRVRETDHDSQQALTLFTIIQRALGLPVTGIYDARTAKALYTLFGPNVLEASWLRVVEAVSRRRQGIPRGLPPTRALAGIDDILASVKSLFAPTPAATNPTNALQRERVAPVDQASPQWKVAGSQVEPLNELTKKLFKDMQHQANRFASTIGENKIGEDGTIGAKTITLATSAIRFAAAHVAPQGGQVGDQAWIAAKVQISNLDWWPANATWVTSTLKANADSLRLPDPATGAFQQAAPVVVIPATGMPVPSKPFPVVEAGLLGLAAWFLLKKKGRR